MSTLLARDVCRRDVVTASPETRLGEISSGDAEFAAVTDIKRIFDAFVSTKEEGLGLGLSISRSIIEAHGGRLWAEPNPDCGVTFHLSLPTSSEADS